MPASAACVLLFSANVTAFFSQMQYSAFGFSSRQFRKQKKLRRRVVGRRICIYNQKNEDDENNSNIQTSHTFQNSVALKKHAFTNFQ
jgi:hypothetical protein